MGIRFEKCLNSQKTFVGRGFLNKAINALPIELHLPGYQFCGPGTKLAKRLARGDKEINPLDAACKVHDIAYSQSKDLSSRHIADKNLLERAWERTLAKDSSVNERANAWFVTNAMKAKVKFGMGSSTSSGVHQNVKKKHSNMKIRKSKTAPCIGKLFTKAIQNANKILRKHKPDSVEKAIKIARKDILTTFRGKKKSLINIPRIIPGPKV